MKITWFCFPCRSAVRREPPWWLHVPDDVLRTIASFLDAGAWQKESQLIDVLNLLQATPEVFVQKLTEYRECHHPYELVYVGYKPLGYRHGEFWSVVFLVNDTFKVGHHKRKARKGDVVCRDNHSSFVTHNSGIIPHSTNSPVYVRRANVNMIVRYIHY